VEITGYMYKFQYLTPISGQISKFQEFQDNAQACNKTSASIVQLTHKLVETVAKSTSSIVIPREIRLTIDLDASHYLYIMTL